MAHQQPIDVEHVARSFRGRIAGHDRPHEMGAIVPVVYLCELAERVRERPAGPRLRSAECLAYEALEVVHGPAAASDPDPLPFRRLARAIVMPADVFRGLWTGTDGDVDGIVALATRFGVLLSHDDVRARARDLGVG